MPRLRPNRSFRDDEVVVCVEAFSSETPVTNTFVQRGQRLLGGDPIVKAHSSRFARDGALAEEYPSPFDEVVEHPPMHDDARPYVLPAIEDQDAAVAIESFYAGGRFEGRFVKKGHRLHRDDPLVRAHPEFFTTAPLPLVDRG